MYRGGFRRTAAVVLCSLTVMTAFGSASSSASSAAPTGYRVLVNRTVVPGLRYMKLKDPTAPNLVYILKADLSRPLRFGVGLARRRAGYERTTSMAARYGAVAAINGDFTGTGGRPRHDFAQNGSFKFTSVEPYSPNVAVSRDESTPFVGPTAPVIDLWVRGSPNPLPIARWNDGAPYTGQTAAFTAAGRIPDDNPCSVRLKTDGRPVWSAKHQAVSRPYRVGKLVCGDTLNPYRGVTLAARRGTPQADALRALPRRQRIRITWTVGWPHVWSTIGGFPMLVKDGKMVGPPTCASYFCYRNPRTGVGFTASGKVLLIVVDGRSTESRGMTLAEFGNLFTSLGATQALNLDGGGSATMVVRGKVKNHPTDHAGERSVTSSVLLLRQARSATAVRTSSTDAGSGSGHPLTALLDPGSTGGMLDALARGVFGPVRLDPASRSVVARFRQSR